MSLHQIAHHVQSAGRGDDKILVHMTPGEVQGLQKLAMAHGGSLTINPETGLPEAGILSAILPMAAGFFLGPAGLGIAKTALGASAIVGGATALATGSLSKGLMAGFGAYGGFGLAEGLAGAGVAAKNAALGSVDDIAAAKAAQVGGAGGYTNKLTDALGATNSSAAVTNASQVANINQPLTGWQKASDVYRGGLATTSVPVPQATQVVLQAPNQLALQTDAAAKAAQLQGAGGYANKLTDALGATKAAAAPVTNWGNVKAGFSDVTSSGTKAWNFVKEHPGPFIGVGVGALQEYQEQQAKDAANAAAAGKKTAYIRPYEMSVAQNQSAYAPSASTAEREFFTQPRFIPGNPYVAKEGGLMASQNYAVGGPVEQMSAQNAVGNNTGYPMAHLQTPMYSNPMAQRPMPTDVIQSGLDAPVDRYTGEQRFAFGGSVASAKAKEPTTDTKYSYNPETMQYTQTTTTAPAANNILGNPIVSGMIGLAPYMRTMGGGRIGDNFSGFNSSALAGGLGGGFMNPKLAAFYGGQQSTPQPTVTTQTSGGTATPYAAQTQQIQTPQGTTITPNINVPEYQTPEQQLGLEGFYDMMDAQLAKKGAQMQGMANGGMAFGGTATATASAREPSSEAKYYYDPATMQYTMNSAPSSSNPFDRLYIRANDPFMKVAAKGMSKIFSALSPTPQLPNQPTVGSTSGGIESPYAAQAQQVQPQTPQGTTITPNINIPAYQTPEQQLGLGGFYDMMGAQLAKKDAQMQNRGMANGGLSGGGTANGGYSLGSYSDGGQLLKGPGDGISDSIPAQIGSHQPARLANNEFVIPARIVSEIGNGSTDAGARRLYEMMDRVQKRRKKTVGKGKVAVDSGAHKELARL